MRSKCIDCKDRYPGCHDTCKDYQAFKEYQEQRKEQRRKAKASDRDFMSYREEVFKNGRQR